MGWIENFPPSKLGMPAKFVEWRPAQAQAIEEIIDSEERFRMVDAPLGMGKSGIGVFCSLFGGGRGAYLTSTKVLQDQMMRDGFPGMVKVQGKGNYQCKALGGQYTCEEYDRWCQHRKCPNGAAGVPGAAMHRKECSPTACDRWAGNCDYKKDVQAGIRAKLVCTNYAYWIAAHRFGATPLGEFDWLICDEAHNAPDEVCRALEFTITPSDLGLVDVQIPEDPRDLAAWSEWAKKTIIELAMTPVPEPPRERAKTEEELKRRKRQLAIIKRREQLAGKCGLLKELHGDWVVESTRHGWQFTPVWPFQHAESTLFQGIKNIVLMSGTITTKTMGLMGISITDYDQLRYPYVFPKKNNPVYHLKTVVLNKHTKPEGIELWLRTIANVLESRKDRKGIIHTVSYQRAQQIMDYLAEHHPKLASMCITHSHGGETKDAVRRYKAASGPCFLVSPSVTTGYDFPYEECEFIIVSKLPFPVMQTAVMKERAARDKNYAGYVMVQELVQSTGRGMRHHDDRCEVFITDDSWFWVQKRYSGFMPSYFKVHTMDWIPRKPMTLAEWRKSRQELEA